MEITEFEEQREKDWRKMNRVLKGVLQNKMKGQ